MKNTHLRPFLALSILVPAACGGDDDVSAETSATDTEGTGSTTLGSTGSFTDTVGTGTDSDSDTVTTTGQTSSTTGSPTTTSDTDSTTTGCSIGSEGCSCTGGGGCDPGLTCADGVCEPTMPVCGNGMLEDGEECDLGAAINSDTGICKTDCTAQICGDSFKGPGESCDDGNDVDDDECSNNCALPSCGDIIVQAGEDCDDGNADNTDDCLNTCVAASCGDSFLQAGVEDCDDGNGDATDMCTSECLIAECGDGFVWAGNETCDDGNGQQGDGCNVDCEPSGQEIETQIIDGGNGNDQGYDVAVNASDEYVVVGRVFAVGGSCDIYVGKFDSAGSELWSDIVGGLGLTCDYARGVTYDSAGNIIVAGTIVDVDRDIWVRKYDKDGNVIWTQTHNQADGGASDFAFDVAVDSNDDAWVVGYVTQAGQGENTWIRKHAAADGTPSAAWTINGAGNGNDTGRGIAIDSADNVLVVGRQYVDATNNFDLFVRKYNAAGTQQWERTFNGTDTASTDEAWGVDTGAADSVIVAGYADNTNEAFDIIVRAYDADGTEAWTHIDNNSNSGFSEYGRNVAFDSDGTAVVVGDQFPVAGDRQVFVRKYSSAGAVYWTNTYNGAQAAGSDAAYGVAFDSAGTVFAAGWERGAGNNENIWVGKYTP